MDEKTSNLIDKELFDVEKAVKWYCNEYLKIVGCERKFERKNSVTLENFVRSMENLSAYPNSRELKTPVKIEWHITKNCNLKCYFCYACAMTEKKKDLSTNSMLKVIEEIHKNNVLEVQIEGGEPFFRKDLSTLLKKLKSKNIKVRLLTNGTILNIDALRAVKQYFTENDVLQISIHGYSAESHDEIVGVRGSYHKVEKFLEVTEEMGIAIRTCLQSRFRGYFEINLCVLMKKTQI